MRRNFIALPVFCIISMFFMAACSGSGSSGGAQTEKTASTFNRSDFTSGSYTLQLSTGTVECNNGDNFGANFSYDVDVVVNNGSLNIYKDGEKIGWGDIGMDGTFNATANYNLDAMKSTIMLDGTVQQSEVTGVAETVITGPAGLVCVQTTRFTAQTTGGV